MDAGMDVAVSFDYQVQAGAILYLKLSGPNVHFIAGPATGTHADTYTASGDAIEFAISDGELGVDFVDNVTLDIA